MTEPRPERHLASHVFNVAILVVGGGALAVMLHRLGIANAKEVIFGIGWWAAGIVGLDLVGLCCDAAAIHAFMRPESRMVSYLRVLAAQASGRAISILTPGGALGEATKVTMLVGHAPRERVVSSIVLFNLASFYLSVVIVLIGVPITLLTADLPHHLQLVVWTGVGILVPLVIGLGILIHRGAIGTVLDAAVKLRILKRPHADALRSKLAEIDSHLKELHADRTSGTRAGIAILIASRVISWIATITLLHAVGIAVHPLLLVGVFSVGVLIGWMSNIVPLGLGIADGGNYALYGMLGAPAASGMFVTLINRARSLTVALLGLAAMGIAHTVNRISIARRNTRSVERARLYGTNGPAK